MHPWLWSLDDVLRTQLGAMGVNVVPLPVEGSARAYDEGKVDSFVGLPSAALAFQWSTQARYVIDLRVGYLTGCLLFSRRAWDTLSHDDQQACESAAAKLQVRIQETTRTMDESLLSGLFAQAGAAGGGGAVALQASSRRRRARRRSRRRSWCRRGRSSSVATWLGEYRTARKTDKR